MKMMNEAMVLMANEMNNEVMKENEEN